MAGKRDQVKDADRFSIVCPDLTRCWVCGSTDRVAVHEIFGGTAGRKKSKLFGLTVPLCWAHHNGSNEGVHFNPQLNDRLHRVGQRTWELNYRDNNVCTPEEARKEFIRIFGKNYILEDEEEPKQRSYVF